MTQNSNEDLGGTCRKILKKNGNGNGIQDGQGPIETLELPVIHRKMPAGVAKCGWMDVDTGLVGFPAPLVKWGT